MGVNFRRLYGAVTEQFLNTADIDILIDQTGGKRVPEHVRGNVHGDGGRIRQLINHIADGLCGKRMSVFIKEEILAFSDVRLEKQGIFLERIHRNVFRQLDNPLLIPFSMYTDFPVIGIDCFPAEPAQLGNAQPGCKEKLYYSNVAYGTFLLIMCNRPYFL